jgi:hypothetical protein
VTAFACFILSALLAAKAVPNPDYVAWAGFKPGSSVTTSTITTQGGPKLSDVENTAKLLEVSREKVILECSGSMEAGDSRLRLPADKQDVLATVSAVADDGKVVDTADETIEVAGKKFATRRVRRLKQAGSIRTETTTWTSASIPGGIARQKIVVMGKDTTETTVEVLRYEIAP